MHYCRFKEQEREEFILLGPPHPGEVLREHVLPDLGMTRRKLAKALGISASTLSKILSGHRRLSPKTAARLAILSGSSALYWLILQAHHDAWQIEHATKQAKPKRSAASRPASSPKRALVPLAEPA